VTFRYGSTDIVRFTGPSGEFDFGTIRGPVAYTLFAKKPGYTFATTSGNLTGDRTFAMAGTIKNYRLTVQVLSPSKAPIVGAIITVANVSSGVTDSQGRVSFMIPAGASYSVSASTPWYQFVERVRTGTMRGDVTRVMVAVPTE
jgi:hypothetical protein